jgi:hypothetical protein
VDEAVHRQQNCNDPAHECLSIAAVLEKEGAASLPFRAANRCLVGVRSRSSDEQGELHLRCRGIMTAELLALSVLIAFALSTGFRSGRGIDTGAPPTPRSSGPCQDAAVPRPSLCHHPGGYR